MSNTSLIEQVRRIADALSPEATWDDVRYQIELHASIDRGQSDIRAGRVVAVEDLIQEFADVR